MINECMEWYKDHRFLFYFVILPLIIVLWAVILTYEPVKVEAAPIDNIKELVNLERQELQELRQIRMLLERNCR